MPRAQAGNFSKKLNSSTNTQSSTLAKKKKEEKGDEAPQRIETDKDITHKNLNESLQENANISKYEVSKSCTQGDVENENRFRQNQDVEEKKYESKVCGKSESINSDDVSLFSFEQNAAGIIQNDKTDETSSENHKHGEERCSIVFHSVEHFSLTYRKNDEDDISSEKNCEIEKESLSFDEESDNVILKNEENETGNDHEKLHINSRKNSEKNLENQTEIFEDGDGPMKNKSEDGSIFQDLEDYAPNSEEILISQFTKVAPLHVESFEGNSEVNILILGQSGVGKSTWINSILNYLVYENLEEAEKGGVLCVIPTSFFMAFVDNEEIVKQVVQVGGEDPNEKIEFGKSGTLVPQTYIFTLGNKLIRLIDTPGIGDTEGIEKDKEHLNNIFNHISFLKEIHGICILLKPNEVRLGTLFSFCLSELLINLHKNAAKNIIFCFTNTRLTFYAPGDTTEVLQQYLTESRLSDVLNLSPETMFCFDNEAFRYLCTLKYDNIPKRKEEREEYNRSWIQSVAETRRLFDQIKALEPHRVADTTNLCTVRSYLFCLMEAIADISKTIQMNLAIIENHKRKISASQLTFLEQMKKLTNMKNIITKWEALDHSRIICTSKNCTKFSLLGSSDITVPEYLQVCHDKCRLRFLFGKVSCDRRLIMCSSFNLKGTCKKCKCSWYDHKLQTYIMKKEEVDDDNPVVVEEILSEEAARKELLKNKISVEKLTKMYLKEQEIILQTFVKFEAFLKMNSLSQCCSSFKDYLKELILEEEKKVNTTPIDDKLLNNLNELLHRYEEEAKNIESINLSSTDVMELIETLYNLKVTGDQIKTNTELTIKSKQMNQMHAEKPLPVGSVTYLD